MPKIKARTEVPELRLQTLSDGLWKLKETKPEEFTMIVFYRGYHCPICKTYLKELNNAVEEFEERGVETICVSSDTEARLQTNPESHRLRFEK